LVGTLLEFVRKLPEVSRITNEVHQTIAGVYYTTTENCQTIARVCRNLLSITLSEVVGSRQSFFFVAHFSYEAKQMSKNILREIIFFLNIILLKKKINIK
jgi:hypothetical protein